MCPNQNVLELSSKPELKNGTEYSQIMALVWAAWHSGTVLVLSEKHEQHVLKFSNNCSRTPNTVTVSVMTRVTCGQCHA